MTLLEYYENKLGIDARPSFLNEYLNLPIMQRLKGITYLCGMDYASKDIYDFKESISRYDHSLTVALLTWMCTHSETETLAGLFHDIATPCFSHVIDYMNEDYEKQDSTEEYTEHILKNDDALLNLLNKDNIDISDLIDFKKYSIVDNERPRLCADRLDGIILTGISWTKEVNESTIDSIIDGIEIYQNEDDLPEIGFYNRISAINAMRINTTINYMCHTYEDNYMMNLLASIVKKAIDRGYITNDSLYTLSEKDLLDKLTSINDIDIVSGMYEFYHIKKDDIPNMILPKVKQRKIKPLVGGIRID